MAEFATNGKANAGLTTGIIGTALSGLLTLGSGVLGTNAVNSNYTAMGTPRWVSQEEFAQQQTITSLESENALLKSEKDSNQKMIEVYERLDTKFRTLEANLNTFKAEQGVINTQMISNISLMQNQIATLNSLTKTVVPIDNVCPEPMKLYNSWTAPTSTT